MPNIFRISISLILLSGCVHKPVYSIVNTSPVKDKLNDIGRYVSDAKEIVGYQGDSISRLRELARRRDYKETLLEQDK